MYSVYFFHVYILYFRIECFCGDSDPPPRKQVDESECRATCSGDSTKKCGGDLKLSIYKTGVVLKQGTVFPGNKSNFINNYFVHALV